MEHEGSGPAITSELGRRDETGAEGARIGGRGPVDHPRRGLSRGRRAEHDGRAHPPHRE